MKKIIAWNTISQVFGKFFQAITALFISVLIARSFGAEGYGDFTKITTFVTFFYLLSDFGFNAIFLKHQENTSLHILWHHVLALRIIWSFILTLVSLGLLWLLPTGVGQGYTSMVRLGILLYCPSIIVQALIVTCNAVFQKYLRYELATIALAIGSIFSLFFIYIISQNALRGIGPVIAAQAIFVASILSVVVSFYYVGKILGTITPLFQKSSLITLFSLSAPLGMTLVFNQVFFRADSFILTLTRTTAEVGVYGFAYKIFEMFLVLPTFFMNALYPLFLKKTSKENAASPVAIRSMFWSAFRYLVLLSLISIVLIFLLSPFIPLVGLSFKESIAPLKILSFGFPFFFISSLTMWTLLTLNQERALFIIYGIGAMFAVSGYIFFIPRYGYIGAAWMTVLSEFLVLILSAYFVLKQFRKSV